MPGVSLRSAIKGGKLEVEISTFQMEHRADLAKCTVLSKILSYCLKKFPGPSADVFERISGTNDCM